MNIPDEVTDAVSPNTPEEADDNTPKTTEDPKTAEDTPSEAAEVEPTNDE